jgi:Mg2+/Co2+ transporter CorB
MVGEFTTQAPSDMGYLRREEDGSWLAEGTVLLRHLNASWVCLLPLDGLKTLNGCCWSNSRRFPRRGEHQAGRCAGGNRADTGSRQ